MNEKLLHYRPKQSYLGDCFPLFVNGIYYIYYLHLNKENIAVWSLIKSRDLINIDSYEEVLKPGDEDSYDSTLLSGCVFFEENLFYAFYSSYGKNKRYNIMLAISKDGIHFEKTNKILFQPNQYYEHLDTWRDPEIFHDIENNLYHMIFCAKTPFKTDEVYSGCIGYAISKDLTNWELKKPFLSPEIGTTLECPDWFKLGDKYVFSYYWHDTKYRVANTLFGKYKKIGISSPTHFDFMAAKCLSDEKRTISFGWIPRKKCDCDAREWGGVLGIPKEIYFNKQKKLVSKFIDEIYDNFEYQGPVKIIDVKGKHQEENDIIAINSKHRGSLFIMDNLSMNYLLLSKIWIDNLNSTFIIFIKYGYDQNSNSYTGYQIVFDFAEKRVFVREQYKWDQRSDLASIPLFVQKNRFFDLEIVVNHDILELCINKEQCLSFRMLKYNEQKNIALSIQDCNIKFKGMKILKKQD